MAAEQFFFSFTTDSIPSNISINLMRFLDHDPNVKGFALL